jgi:elongation factor 1-gamma
MSFTNTEVLPKLGGWFRPLIGKDPFNKVRIDESKNAALMALRVLEQHLQHRSFLVSEGITLADFFAASMVSRGFMYVLDAAWRSENPNITRWYRKTTNEPSWKAVVTSSEMIEFALVSSPIARED